VILSSGTSDWILTAKYGGLHGEYLLVEGKKMSKSRGNVTYIKDLLAWGFQPHHIRFYLLYGPYRENLDLRMKLLDERSAYLDRVRNQTQAILEASVATGKTGSGLTALDGEYHQLRNTFVSHMDDNLDFKNAFDGVAKILGRISAIIDSNNGSSSYIEKLKTLLIGIDSVFGVLL
jgi:cysteinyl-tRNA synthetase